MHMIDTPPYLQLWHHNFFTAFIPLRANIYPTTTATMPSSSRNTAHDVFLQFHRHRAQSVAQLTEANEDGDGAKPSASLVEQFDMFHQVMKTGVIYATSRANKHGFSMEDPDWANMGQGAPETGPLPGAPARDFHMNIQDAELEYAPTAGTRELRQKVADYYNFLYR